VIRRPRVLPALAPALAAALLASCGSKGASADAHYTITLRYCAEGAAFSSCTADPGNATATDITPAERAAFEAARARVASLITAGLVPARTRDAGGPLQCGEDTGNHVTLDQTVHGILILVTVTDLGGGGTIASSGPCIVRSSSHLPLVAIMQFNSRLIDGYAADGRLATVAFHEMLHTLGFGTVWTDFHPPLLSGAWTLDSGFTGARAVTALKSDNGGLSSWTTVPLENCGMVADPTCYETSSPEYNPLGYSCCLGTRDSHWDDAYFAGAGGAEVMTGYIPGVGTLSPLSATTLAALRDLGYSVDMTKAEPFSVDTAGLRALTSREPGLDLSGDVLQLPLRYADDTLPPE